MKTRFKFATLRQGQAEVVFQALQGQRVLFVAPTGHGKSLCYQALAANPWSQGVVLVFTPLKALMAEQVAKARALGLRADLVNSDQDADDQQKVLDQAVGGALEMLFIAPERLDNALWQSRVPQMAVKGVIIDEAHCISQWGHDFRPSYRRLVRIVVGLGLRTPVLAVTATAPGRVVTDVSEQIARLGVSPAILRLPSSRDNLRCQIQEVTNLEGRLVALAEAAVVRKGQAGIAYFVTQREAEQAARLLVSLGCTARHYHSGLALDEKSEVLVTWNRRQIDVVCATSALGMGIDRADVRWVFHSGLPSSLIQYVQEIGRAGRDGQPADVLAVHDPTILEVHQGMITGNAPDPEDYPRVVAAVASGVDKRTSLIEALDLPETYMQRLLDDLVQSRALVRSGSPAIYSVGTGSLPEDSAAARGVRFDLLDEAWAWPGSDLCRRIGLARAMGDASLPLPCKICDRCVAHAEPRPQTVSGLVGAFLATDRPRVSGPKNSGLLEGVALSWYKLGDIGRQVAEAKQARRMPMALVDDACRALREAPLKDLRPVGIVTIPPSQSGDLVGTFAAELGQRLGIPVFPLERVRTTVPQKNRRARHNKEKNVEGAFQAGPGTPVQGNLLLLDDIWDSGATLREAAKLLKRAGREVRPLVLARTRHADDQ